MVQAFGRLPYLLLHKILHLLWIGSLLAPFSVLAAPGDILFSDNFERGAMAPWTTTNGSRSGILTGLASFQFDNSRRVHATSASYRDRSWNFGSSTRR